ncbi:VOC family protein [Streptomyces sp. NPDC006527]|jgi:predicted enzyme related to lactoylglutathione lyase|uniref:VOC family protein n=1 Tax=Streptomyces sp. NPDC006527 TaxID=3364749 RepID=UPI0036CC4B89
MSDDLLSYDLLGFDNVLLPVGNLGQAVGFYERAGFAVKFRFDEAGIALLECGGETPGILLREEEALGHRPPPWGSPRLWLEVPDARATARRLASAGIPPLDEPFAVATGWTVEVADPWGNVLGFTDYSKRPELGRALGAATGRPARRVR